VKTPVFLIASLCAVVCAQAQESFGTIKSTTKLRPDNTSVTTVKDPEKHTWEETVTDASGKVQRKTTYVLDDRDLAIGAIFADGKGNILYKASYQQDGQGRTIEATFTSADGRYLGKRRFIFDSGPTARVEDYDANGVLIARPQAVVRPRTTAPRTR
jgi:hypothetical protein